MIFTMRHASRTMVLLGAVVGVLLFSGCVRKTKPQAEPVTYRCQQEQDGVSVSVELMPVSVMASEFGVNFHQYGFVPLSLTIHNQTPDVLMLRGQSIHTSLEDPLVVAGMAHYNTFFWTSYASYMSCVFFWPALLPSLGGGYYMSQANAAITKNVCASGLSIKDSLDILPFERIYRVLFVPANAFTSNFRMHLFNVHSKAFIPFNVGLGVKQNEDVQVVMDNLAQA